METITLMASIASIISAIVSVVAYFKNKEISNKIQKDISIVVRGNKNNTSLGDINIGE